MFDVRYSKVLRNFTGTGGGESKSNQRCTHL